MKKLVIMSLVVLVAVFLAAPSAMAKKQLTDGELDLITAAGEPMVITATGSVQYTDEAAFDLSLPEDAQAGIAALVVNNLVGELQIANAFNIQAATGTVSGTDQSNDITQSWGSTKDYTFGFVSVAGTDGGDAIAGNANVCEPGAKCNSPIAVGDNVATGGAGAPGVIAGAVASTYADVIIDSEAEVIVNVAPVYSLELLSGAQADLVALVVNNVAGMSQVANAINIAGGTLIMNPAASMINTTGGTTAMVQANTISQCRGTPCGRPGPPVAFSPLP